jgi:hypothetical protein
MAEPKRSGNPNVGNAAIDTTRLRETAEVGSEGGGRGDVEVGIDRGAGTGSEAGETWRPIEEEVEEAVHDETGEGRRNP